MEAVRAWLRENLEFVRSKINEALADKEALSLLEAPIARNSPGNTPPEWYGELMSTGKLSTGNGKSLGSIVEKICAAVIEVHVFEEMGIDSIEIQINPAKGVDLPALELGIKSPSENWDTSEPFDNPFERVTGNKCDCIVLLTNFQRVKRSPLQPYVLSIIVADYLLGSEVSDRVLTESAKGARKAIGFGDNFVEYVRFLCLMNKNDAEAKELKSRFDFFFVMRNVGNELKDDEMKLMGFYDESGIYGEAFLWNSLTSWLDANAGPFRDLPPRELDVERLRNGPLKGRISISFALQWRYTFRTTFSYSDEYRDTLP